MKTEIWKDIQGYEGIYQISNLGRVRTVSRFVVNNTNGGMRFCKGKIMSHFDNGNGYKVVTLKQFDTLVAALFYKSMCLGGD